MVREDFDPAGYGEDYLEVKEGDTVQGSDHHQGEGHGQHHGEGHQGHQGHHCDCAPWTHTGMQGKQWGLLSGRTIFLLSVLVLWTGMLAPKLSC